MSAQAPHALVLVCDDEEDAREMLSEYLERRGFQVSTAAHAEAMRTAIEETAPDAIILDINMPGEDGLSALRRLRSSLDTPVIMLTARGEEDDRVRGLDTGADDYLTKPFSVPELTARVRALLRRSRPTLAPDVATFGDLLLDRYVGQAVARRDFGVPFGADGGS